MLVVMAVVGRSSNGGGEAKDDELSHSWPAVWWVAVYVWGFICVSEAAFGIGFERLVFVFHTRNANSKN